MTIARFVRVGLMLAVLLSLAVRADAATPEEAGRAILERYGPAMVTLKLTVKMRMTYSGQDKSEESKTETIGTVLDESGLTAVSLSTIDPSDSVQSVATQRANRSGTKLDLKVESEVSDVTIMLGDGTTLPAHVVLRDKDSDLALIRPTSKPAKAMVHVDISANATPQVLDQFVALYRLGKMANRAPVASLERVNAMVSGPRPYYVPESGGGLSGIGSPAFNLDGTLLGFLLLKSAPPEDDGNIGSMFNGAASMGLMPIIVPAAQIRDSVAQAREAGAE